MARPVLTVASIIAQSFLYPEDGPMVRFLLLVVPLAALAGCKTENKAFCDDLAHAGMQGCPGDASNGGGCGSDGDCKAAGFPACDLTISQGGNRGTCEPCTPSNRGVCMGTMPRCEKNTCVACVDDVQDCQGGVCLATGDCADTSHILHASSGSTKTSNCGAAATPCSLAGALMLAIAGKNVIKLDDTGPFMASGANGFTVSNDVTIDARSATLNRTDNGPLWTINTGKTLTLLGGTLSGARGSNGTAIVCNNGATLSVDQTTITGNEQFGIDATNCTLTVTRARIENNIATGVKANGGSFTLVRTWLNTNSGGGVDVNNGAKFTIVGNVFVNNGTTGSQIGGIGITTSASGNRLEFNSVAENKAQPGTSAGITCAANAGFVAKNNIIWSNNSYVAAMAGIQVFGGCGHSYSDIGPLGITGPSDTGNNQNNDPKFKDKATDLHLTSVSPLQLLQPADPSSSLTDIAAKDIDGEARTSPVYIGADQYYPPKP
jgi:hypothetical protein